jgi:hypothetical protein
VIRNMKISELSIDNKRRIRIIEISIRDSSPLATMRGFHQSIETSVSSRVLNNDN